MPIYEFFCKNCNTIFKFFSRTIDTETVPPCPKCNSTKMERKFSTFSTTSDKELDDEDFQLDSSLDEGRVHEALAMMEGGTGFADRDDPRKAVEFMRNFNEVSGIPTGPNMEEALKRYESGEDPQVIQEEMGDLLKQEVNELTKKKKTAKKSADQPDVDDELYEM